MSTADHAKNLGGLLRSLKTAYDVEPPPERGAIDELVLSFLMWEATAAKAEAALKRVHSGVVDFNELRVCKAPEIVGMLGKQYPRVEERAQRLRAALNEIYLREFAVSLDACAALSKRDARRYIETLEGVPAYVAARVVLLRLGGHALPVDERLLGRLIESNVVEPGDDVAKASGILERHVKAGEGVFAHQLLQAWSDDASAEPSLRGPKPRRAEEKSVATAAPSGGDKARKKRSGHAAPSKSGRGA